MFKIQLNVDIHKKREKLLFAFLACPNKLYLRVIVEIK